MKTIMITGVAGFIMSHLADLVLYRPRESVLVVGVDNFSDGSNPDNMKELLAFKSFLNTAGFEFHTMSVQHPDMRYLINHYRPDGIIHGAAETFVDRSIENPHKFMDTNANGTSNMLEAVLRHCPKSRFHYISTDEVYGPSGISRGFHGLEEPGAPTENSPLRPTSPYAASKAAGDLLVQSFHKTYGLDTVITRSSNNFGIRQYEEKLIPKTVRQLMAGERIGVYGKGNQIRDWIHVRDHIWAIWKVYKDAKPGSIYNIPGTYACRNLELVTKICRLMEVDDKEAIEFVDDRPAHDMRYNPDGRLLRNDFQFVPMMSFEHDLKQTIDWYKEKWQDEAWVVKKK